MSKLNIYQEIPESFYDDQLSSINPLRRWFHVNRYRVVDSFVRSFYTPGMKIVDLGSGSCGWNTNHLPVTGIDYSEPLLAFGKKRGRLIDYKVTDILDTGFSDGTFQIAVGTEILEHIEDVEAAVMEAYRILDPHGVFILSVPYDDKFSLWRALFFFQVLFQGYVKGDSYYKNRCGHIHHFTPQTLNDLLESKGFEVDLLFSAWRMSIFLLARKGPCSPQERCDDLTVVIPVKNEVDNIRDVLVGLLDAYPDVNIIVSDDGSTDGTADVIRRIGGQYGNIEFLDRRERPVKGLTVSVLDAIDRVGSPYFIVMDGDGQHEVKYVRRIYNQLKLKSKLCVASRVSVPGLSWNRKILSLSGSMIGKTVLFARNRTAPPDILSGFFGVETDYWRNIVKGRRNSFSLEGYKVLVDFLKMCEPGAGIEDVFFVFNMRTQGSSKMNWKIYLEYVRSLIR